MKEKKKAFFVSILITIILALSITCVVHGAVVLATVTVGQAISGVVYDSGKGEIFVTNPNSGIVSVISDSNNNVVATIPVGVSPGNLAYDSGRGEIFVANQNYKDGMLDFGTVSVISAASSASSSPSPTTSASPSPTVPEFSVQALISVMATAGIVVTISLGSLRKNRLNQKQ